MTLSELRKTDFPFMTDKGDEEHSFKGVSYLDVYEKLFSKWKDETFSFLEIGICQGFSLRLWREYFKKARILGIDIDPNCLERELLKGEKIELFLIDQSDREALVKFAEQNGPFRGIVDDGSHLVEHSLICFEVLWPRLEDKGIYVIEDTTCFYHPPWTEWPGMKFNKEGTVFQNDRKKFDDFLLELVKEMDHLKGEIREIQIHPQQVVFRKV